MESDAALEFDLVVSLLPKLSLRRPKSSLIFLLSCSDRTLRDAGLVVWVSRLMGGSMDGGFLRSYASLILPKLSSRLSSSFLLILVSMVFNAYLLKLRL